jgi:hypothetical protein
MGDEEGKKLAPSFPTASPAATENITPPALQTNVFIRVTCGILMPFK